MRVQLCLFSLAATACFAADAPKITVARWPGGRVAAVSLTFDDGLQTHLDVAGPVLKKHGLHGTFFVNTSGGVWREHAGGWRRLAAEGNELGNHTASHPCLSDEITPAWRELTPAMMEAEVRGAAREIAKQTGATRGMTFAFPCGNTSFGAPGEQARNSALYLQYVADCCFAARAYTGSGAQNPDEMNVLGIVDLGRTVGRDGPGLLAMLEPAVRNGAWGIYTFHGTGGQYLSVSAGALDELAGYLERHPEIWTATFGDAMRYTQERRSLGIEMAGAAEARLSWPLDPKIYDLPLTLRVELPEGWTSARVEGAAASKMAGRVLFADVPQGTKIVRIVPGRG
ncbi:MAG: polysaccharide deacetylase family protein [Acidobacteriota bacterium]